MNADTWVLGLLGLTVYAWFSAWTGFLVIASAKRIRAAGVSLPTSALVVVYIWGILGWPGDVLYNTIIGTIQYWEFPKWLDGEFLYSHRIERLANHAVAPNGEVDFRRAESLEFARVLNAADKDHIDLPEIQA